MKISHWLGVVFLITILFILLSFIPEGIDFHNFMGATRSWASGKGIYHGEPFYNLPHSLLLLFPLSLLPVRIGQTVINLISLVTISLSLRELVGKISIWGLLVVWCNLITFNLFAQGQWDGLLLGGVALSVYALRKHQPILFGVGLSIISTKPINLIPVVLLLIWMIRGWTIRDFVKVTFVPFSCLIFSFIACGLDWPVRYISHYVNYPPPQIFNISLWRQFPIPITALFSVIILLWVIVTVKRTSANRPLERNLAINVALLSGVLVSPYVMGYHYILAVPAFAWLALRSKFLSFLAWGISFAPLVVEYTGVPYLLYHVYILAIAFGVAFVMATSNYSPVFKLPRL